MEKFVAFNKSVIEEITRKVSSRKEEDGESTVSVAQSAERLLVRQEGCGFDPRLTH